MTGIPPSEVRDEVVQAVRSRLSDVRAVRRLSWQVGKTLHHTVPRLVDDSPSSRGSSRPCFTGETIPTYPYRDTPFEPLALRPSPDAVNPVLTAADVTDYGRAEAVADPFVFATASGEWHMFFEVYNQDADPTAVIGHATSPDGGRSWAYDRVVLRTDLHLSFPYVFQWKGSHYLVPDSWDKSGDASAVRLYEARDFPYGWTEVAAILSPDRPMSDAVVFRWRDRWWALAGDERNLYAFHSPTLRTDDWEPHDENPVVRNRPRAARPGGRPIVRDDRILLFLQECTDAYGERLRAFAITELSPERYDDAELDSSPTLEASDSPVGWNSGKMHHIDPWFDGTTWRCAVDGNLGFGSGVFGQNWSIGMYESVASAPNRSERSDERLVGPEHSG